MKKSRWIAAVLAVLLTCGMFSACDNGNTPDGPGTEITSSDTEAPAAPNIIEADRTTRFFVVRGDRAAQTVVDAAVLLRNYFREIGVETTLTDDWEQNEQRSDYEILVGKTVREKPELYEPDRALLGKDGYIIHVVGTKIFLCGGSDEATVAAVKHFISLLPKEGAFSLMDGYIYTYAKGAAFRGLTLAGNPFAELPMEAQGETAGALLADVQKLFFEKTGTMTKTGSASRVVLKTEGDAAVFRAEVKDGKLLLTGSERIGIYRGIRDFFDALAAAGTALPQNASLSEAGCLNLAEGLVYTKDYGTFVTYEEFGAKGDGKTDDADALVQAHAAAKERKLPLLAKETATYYIGGKKNIILISTDTDWSRAHFIIDDTKVEDRSTEVFKITFEYASQAVDLKSLKAGQQNIGITFDYPVALTVYNDKVKQYIREGKNQNDGSTMRDIVLVDKEGNVDPTTPILWDFDSISSATARRVEEMPLTVMGGVITTVANKETDAKYYYRGIRIYRSNVIFDGLEHYVEGEGATGAPYYGILIFHSSMNCTVKNVTFTAHKTYTSIGTAGQKVSNGTYDLTVTNSANFTALNCTQTTDINNGAYWGVFASNYSRNILFDGCTFSRFDAHCGVCNVTLRNCELGHQGINLIGHGTALIENCTVRSQYFINLRSDYGSTWDGDLIILGCTYIPKNGASCDAVIVNGSYNGTHDFGYTCHLPRNIVINGLYVDDSHQKTKDAPVYLFANINPNWNSDGYTAAFPMTVTKSVTAKNLVTARGKSVEISPNKYMFKGLEIQYVI